MHARFGLRWLVTLSLSTLCMASAFAADIYPAKPIRMVLPFPAGSGMDNAARLFTQTLASTRGWQFVIENKPGASGFIAAQEAKRAAPDGYTLFFTGNTTHGANSALFKTLPYDPVADFVPIIRNGVFPLVLLGAPKHNWSRPAEVVAMAKQRPNDLTFAAGSAGPRVAGEKFAAAAGIDIRYVAYKSSPQALTDLIGGHVDFMFLDSVAAIPQVRGGTLKALAVTSTQRIASLPDVPTMNELGFKDFQQTNWAGVFAPRGTPVAITENLHQEFASVINSAAWQKFVADLGGYADVTTPAQTAAWVTSEIDSYKTVLQRAGVMPE